MPERFETIRSIQARYKYSFLSFLLSSSLWDDGRSFSTCGEVGLCLDINNVFRCVTSVRLGRFQLARYGTEYGLVVCSSAVKKLFT